MLKSVDNFAKMRFLQDRMLDVRGDGLFDGLQRLSDLLPGNGHVLRPVGLQQTGLDGRSPPEGCVSLGLCQILCVGYEKTASCFFLVLETGIKFIASPNLRLLVRICVRRFWRQILNL